MPRKGKTSAANRGDSKQRSRLIGDAAPRRRVMPMQLQTHSVVGCGNAPTCMYHLGLARDTGREVAGRQEVVDGGHSVGGNARRDRRLEESAWQGSNPVTNVDTLAVGVQVAPDDPFEAACVPRRHAFRERP
eukprot:7530614-Pyramimonas_sp.AAC.1